MGFTLYSIDEAIDRKFVVTKTISSQAKAGTLIHIMGTKEKPDQVSVKYRVTESGQDFVIKFDNVKQFCKWARPDNFIARNYERLTNKEITHYLKVMGRTVVSFCLPIILIALVVIWGISLFVIKSTPTNLIVGAAASAVAAIAVLIFYKVQKNNVKMRLYQKVSSNWGVVFK